MDSSSVTEKHEECGIIAIYSKHGKNVAPLLYNALMALQHRGQDAAGFVVYDGKKLIEQKGIGLVSEIFKEDSLKVRGSIGIGHTRYPTTGRCFIEDVQPTAMDGVATAHNGHIANYNEIKRMIGGQGHILKSNVDSEPIAYMLHEGMSKGKTIDENMRKVMETLDGAYSDVAIVNGVLAVFRDPHAIRPLVYGETGDYICFASETCALDINGIPYTGNVDGGELITIENGELNRRTIMEGEPRYCMFEYVYFSRPDSIINGRGVFEVRKLLGEQLAKEHPVAADIVVPVPDTARTAAETFAKATKIPFEEGLIKNRYVGRTFIMPSQDKRTNAVRLKLNPVREIIAGKRVVLVDDSIVRGTTLREIVRLVRGAGAKEIHLRITCPPVKAPCFYGVDMSTYKELIANNKSIEEIRRFLDVDSLGYISIGGLRKAVGLPICTGCLNEDYITQHARKLAKEKRDGGHGCC